MDVAEAKDRMLEVENLTDALEDDNANWLLDWGTKQVGPLIQGIADDDQAGEKVNQLMGVMRSINRITGDRNAAPADELTDDVHQLVDKYNAAFGAGVNPSDDEVKALVARIAALNEHDAMQALLSAVTQPGAATPTPTPASASAPAAASQPASAPQSAAPSAPAANEAKPAEASASTTNTADAAPSPAAPTQQAPQSAQSAQPAQSEAAKQDKKQSGASGQEESHA